MLLEDIDLTKLLMLVQELKVQDAWRIVAKSCGLDPALHLGGLSADDLVLALMNRQTRVEDLRECLETLNLQKALSIISEPDKLQITRQPHCDESAQDCLWENDTLLVRIGGQLRLKIEATGTPIPSYLWFRDNIPLSSSPNLVIENFSEHMEGLYYCIVQQQEDYGWEKRVISKDVTIKVSIKVQSEAPQIVCCKPTGKYELERGQDLVAHVEVAPGPPTTYSWWHKGKLLKTFTSNVLIVSEVGENNAGTYECRVKNKFGESSSEFELDVKKRPYPTEKKALIITNSLYMKMQQLRTPHHDAISLKNGLSEFNFDCTHLQDLTAADMSREIVSTVLLGGHGLMKNNTKYLMGCDADPDNLKVEQVLPETLLEEVQGADPTLFMSILDMCQISINGFNFEVQQSTNKWTNAVLCYATSQNRLAYEPANSLNSVYMKHLQNVLLYEQNLSFVDMILKVNSRVQDDKPDQVPQVSIVGENHFKLSDVVRKN